MSTDPTSFVPDIDCDNNNNFFDHIIDDLLDFPQHNAFVGGRGNSFPSAWNASPFSCFDPDCSPELAAELSVPYEDIVQMEWLSDFVEDSFSDGKLLRSTDVPGIGAGTVAPIQFHLSSPVSVLENSSSSSSSSSSSMSNGGNIQPFGSERNDRSGYGRARTKRTRPSTFNPGSAMQLISLAHTSLDAPETSEAGQKRKRNRAPEINNNETNPDPMTSGVRKCLHCEITKTPQWRTGPMGPKTLCNACGVRHKSGRLFPEYRPAASPTFVPTLHSNSHKKVIEMRISSVNISPTSTLDDTTA